MTYKPTRDQLEAAADLIAFVLISDGILSTDEIDALDTYQIPEGLGLSHDDLLRAVARHCEKQLARVDDGQALRIVDVEQFEAKLDRVDDPTLREFVARAMFVIAKADGRISLPEQTLLRDMLTRWDISLEALRK